jgi:hypothetical protein
MRSERWYEIREWLGLGFRIKWVRDEEVWKMIGYSGWREV